MQEFWHIKNNDVIKSLFVQDPLSQGWHPYDGYEKFNSVDLYESEQDALEVLLGMIIYAKKELFMLEHNILQRLYKFIPVFENEVVV